MQSPSTWHLAELNIARLRAPIDDPLVAEFVEGLAEINALADRSAGFVWRLQTDEGNATSVQLFPDADVIVNLSVWDSIAALKQFTYSSDHAGFFRRRAEWFDREGSGLAMWWVPAGSTPTALEAVRRLEFLRTHGASPHAFTFARPGRPLLIESAGLEETTSTSLIAELDAELAERYPEPGSNFFRLDVDEVRDGSGVFLVARLDGDAVGCGAVRSLGDGCAEIKRMYVAPRARGLRIGYAILSELEHEAKLIGANRLVLETGIRQPEALRVYERAGFVPIPCWGEYVGVATSVCLAKDIDAGQAMTAGPDEHIA
jgi:GNAT superfamily N-acetyltransferase